MSLFKKISDKVNTFDCLTPEDFMGVNDVSLKQILQLFDKKADLPQNVVLGSFKDGEPYTFTQLEREKLLTGDEEVIKSLTSSYRITNIQLFYQPIEKLCLKVLANTELSVSVNLYITPNSHSQCFVYHGDVQDTLVWQILGQKKWMLPKMDGEYAYAKDNILPESSFFNLKSSVFEQEIFTMKTGDIITFPYNLVHKAENQENFVSAHLTFATHPENLYQLKNSLAQTLLNIRDTQDNFFKPIQLDEVCEILISQEHFDFNNFINDYYQMSRQKESRRLKEGRDYA